MVVMQTMCLLIMNFADFTVERIPSLLAVLGHFSEALVARSNQDHNLTEEEVKVSIYE